MPARKTKKDASWREDHPKKGKEREDVMSKCGSRCFLMPKERRRVQLPPRLQGPQGRQNARRPDALHPGEGGGRPTHLHAQLRRLQGAQDERTGQTNEEEEDDKEEEMINSFVLTKMA
jgi:hypothetical protein